MNRMMVIAQVAAGLVAGLLLAPAALAQSSQHDHGAGQTSHPSADGAAAKPAERPGAAAGHGMMSGMMGSGEMKGMMGPGTTGHVGMSDRMDMPCGMAEAGMMHRMMAMMHPNMMQGQGRMAGPAMAGRGMRVTAVQHLSEDDVRHFFEHWLDRHGNSRLKVGTVQQADDDTITAEIVTVDDSLVQRYRIDRHSGEVSVDRS